VEKSKRDEKIGNVMRKFADRGAKPKREGRSSRDSAMKPPAIYNGLVPGQGRPCIPRGSHNLSPKWTIYEINWQFTGETNSGCGRKRSSNGTDNHNQLCITDYAIDGGSVR
jgi:hypothetical protein